MFLLFERPDFTFKDSSGGRSNDEGVNSLLNTEWWPETLNGYYDLIRFRLYTTV